MIHLSVFAFALSMCPPAPTESAEPDCAVLVPGQSLGRFSLGTVLQEDSAVTADALPGWFRPSDPAGAGTRLRFDDEKRLVTFDALLPACVTLAGTEPVTLRAPTLHQLAAALGTCGPEQILEGGNRIECAGVSLTTRLGENGLEARVAIGGSSQVAAARPCAYYADAAGVTEAFGVSQPGAGPVTIAVGDGSICVAGRPAPITSETRVEDVGGPACAMEVNRGGTSVRCGDTVYRFAGPKLALQSIEIVR